jgi:hypothetical protein
MQTQRSKLRPLIAIVAIAGLWLPMADGCHKHSKVLAAEKQEKAKPYPLDKCVVSDEKLGSMGKPYVFTHEGQEIKLCCKDCLKDFKKEPAKYTKKIADASKDKK